MPLNFYELYNLLNENVEESFDKWLELVFQYTKKNTDAEKVLMKISGVPVRADLIGKNAKDWQDSEKAQLKYIIDGPQEVYIKQVLKEKNIENFNWFSFCIGYFSTKPSFFKEDLELAIEVTKNRIASRELPKTEIGGKGWLLIGYESLDHVKKYLRQQQELSNRQKLKLRKKGETLEEDESLIKLLDQKNNFKLYFLPSIATDKDNKYHDSWSAAEYVNKRESRKRLLCKYGKDTDWCTANPTGGYHEYYVDQDIYILHENDKPKYQFTGCHRGIRPQFMNVKDETVEAISQKEMEFLYYHLGKCYEDMEVKLEDPEQYLNSEFKERISLEDILDLCQNKEASPEVLKDIYSRHSRKDYRGSGSWSGFGGILDLLCKNPNTPEEILVDIYKKDIPLPGGTKKSLAENPSTPKEILKEISEFILDPGSGKSKRLYTDIANPLAKNKNSDIEVLKNLLTFLKRVDNRDYKARFGVDILKNPNSKKDPELVEEIVKIVRGIILDQETYDFTLTYLRQQEDLPSDLSSALLFARKTSWR